MKTCKAFLAVVAALMVVPTSEAATQNDKDVTRLRSQTSKVQKIRRSVDGINRDIAELRALMEASGVVSEETLKAVQNVSTEIEQASNKNFRKSLELIAVARDNVNEASTHVKDAIVQQTEGEAALERARKNALSKAELGRFVDLLKLLRDELVLNQKEIKRVTEARLAGKSVDTDRLAEKQHRTADQLEKAQTAMVALQKSGDVQPTPSEYKGKTLDGEGHGVARHIEDDQHRPAATRQTALIAWIDKILKPLEQSDVASDVTTPETATNPVAAGLEALASELRAAAEELAAHAEENPTLDEGSELLGELVADHAELGADLEEALGSDPSDSESSSSESSESSSSESSESSSSESSESSSSESSESSSSESSKSLDVRQSHVPV